MNKKPNIDELAKANAKQLFELWRRPHSTLTVDMETALEAAYHRGYERGQTDKYVEMTTKTSEERPR